MPVRSSLANVTVLYWCMEGRAHQSAEAWRCACHCCLRSMPYQLPANCQAAKAEGAAHGNSCNLRKNVRRPLQCTGLTKGGSGWLCCSRVCRRVFRSVLRVHAFSFLGLALLGLLRLALVLLLALLPECCRMAQGHFKHSTGMKGICATLRCHMTISPACETFQALQLRGRHACSILLTSINRCTATQCKVKGTGVEQGCCVGGAIVYLQELLWWG